MSTWLVDHFRQSEKRPGFQSEEVGAVSENPNNNDEPENADTKIIASLKTEEMNEAFNKIQSMQESSDSINAVPGSFESELFNEHLTSDEDINGFKEWVDQNPEFLEANSKMIFDQMNSYFNSGLADKMKYDKISYLLEKIPMSGEDIESEKELYFKIARDESPDSKTLVLDAFRRLEGHRGLDERQKYRECVEFIRQRNNPDEINALVEFYAEKNPHLGDQIKEEVNDNARSE